MSMCNIQDWGTVREYAASLSRDSIIQAVTEVFVIISNKVMTSFRSVNAQYKEYV